jgi:hypothetical protein
MRKWPQRTEPRVAFPRIERCAMLRLSYLATACVAAPMRIQKSRLTRVDYLAPIAGRPACQLVTTIIGEASPLSIGTDARKR